MKKLAIVINGCGGVGKDTLCQLAAKHFSVQNISSVTPIKELASMCGWNGSKDRRSRKFLSDLKRLCARYNDYPNRWVCERYQAFLASEDEILFVHIREGQEIEKFVKSTDGRAKTLLIRGGERFVRRTKSYGNASDDDVENYPYDYFYTNDKTLPEAEMEFCALLSEMLASCPLA
ncbi:MAG: hypothetical protein IJW83_05190 [Clostridia bacterium]|nr:hypothetical protein [Clostridia bacterium]